MSKGNGKYSLLLVSPRHEHRNMWTLKEVGLLAGKKVTSFPLALPTIAALTPPRYDIRIVDEEMEPVPFGERFDLVGVSSMVTNARRGCEIADAFRRAGSTVVMGGPYTTFSGEEALRHADAAVVGEAEELWEGLLEDFERGGLKKTYRAGRLSRIARMPAPRWDLVDTSKVLSLNVQVSRGCPYGCDFCCVPAMFGRRQRWRDVDNVVAEIAALPLKQLSFVDDNLTADKKYARELMSRLKGLGVSWTCLTSLDVAGDESLLRDMAEAGCHSLMIGFESLDAASLAECHKKHNKVERYEEAIRRVHAAGIHVIGAFVVGFDADTERTFDDIYDFCLRNALSYVMLNMLTVYPGTALHRKLEAQGRLLDVGPEMRNGIFPTMRYANVTPRRMFDRYFETLARLYSWGDLRRKALDVFGRGAFTRHRTGVGLREKIAGIGTVLRTYLLTGDAERRRFFLDLVRLGVREEAGMDSIFAHLMFVAAVRAYLDEHLRMKESLFSQVAARI